MFEIRYMVVSVHCQWKRIPNSEFKTQNKVNKRLILKVHLTVLAIVRIANVSKGNEQE